MKNIHILSTDKPSRFYSIANTFSSGYGFGEHYIPDTRNTFKNCNIYITSDKKIKEGDWFLNIKSGAIGQHNGAEILLFKDDRKIILTTDQDLIKDGVQEIDDEFLEWFVNNSSCDSVKIDLVPVNEFGSEITVGGYGFDKFKYKIIILKEEPNPFELPNPLTVGKEFYESADKNITVYRQETLEEVAEKWVFETNGHKWSNNDDTAGDNFASFIAGAKWQQEQDKSKYGEEEVRKISLDFFYHWWNSKGTNTEQGFDKWFEQLKKK
jgi:hypothetical protein